MRYWIDKSCRLLLPSIMKYPKEIESRLSEIQEIVRNWPVDKNLSEVIRWVLQFDSIDFDIAIRILRNLNVIGHEDLCSALSIAYSKLMRHAKEKGRTISIDNTLYITFGSAAKSGSLVAYNFRCINGLSSVNFLTEANLQLVKEGKFKNLVLLDDIIATGKQSSELVAKIAEKARSLGINDIYVISAIGFKSGIEKILSTQVAEVFSAIEYDDIDTVVSLDCNFYLGLPFERRNATKDKLTKKYKGIGYDGFGGLIVFYYNTPNDTINCIWNDNNGCIPLFPRKTDTVSKGPELYTLDELTRENIVVSTGIPKPDCNIYVEGKFEELFIQELANQNAQFGYNNLNVISIGPFYNSNLIRTLKSLANKVFFVTTEQEDSNTPHAKSIEDNTKDIKLTRIKDVMTYFSIDKIREDDVFKNVIDWQYIDDCEEEGYKYQIIENKLFRKAVSAYRFDNIRELIEKCKNDGIDELINIFKKQ